MFEWRLGSTDSSLPPSLQFMMFAGAIVTFVLICVMGGQGSTRAHLLMVLAVTGIIAFNLVLAITMDYPFSGDVAVSNGPYYEGALNFR